MAQVHALVLVAAKPLSTDKIMAGLQVSRGKANMNIREFMGWKLMDKSNIAGNRKEYFAAEFFFGR